MNELREIVKDCRTILLQVSDSCCDKGRSEQIRQIDKLVDQLDNSLTIDNAAESQASMMLTKEIGQLIGGLHVSCCTETRELFFSSCCGS